MISDLSYQAYLAYPSVRQVIGKVIRFWYYTIAWHYTIVQKSQEIQNNYETKVKTPKEA